MEDFSTTSTAILNFHTQIPLAPRHIQAHYLFHRGSNAPEGEDKQEAIHEGLAAGFRYTRKGGQRMQPERIESRSQDAGCMAIGTREFFKRMVS